MKINPYLKFFLTLGRIDKARIFRIIIFSIFYISAESAVPFLIRNMIYGINYGNFKYILSLGVLVLFTYSLIRIFWGLSDYEVAVFKIKVKGHLRRKIYEKIIKLPISYFFLNKSSKGEIISKMTGDIDIIGENSPLLPALFCSFLELIVLTVVLIKLNLILALITIFTFPLYAIFEKKFKPKLEKSGEKERKKSDPVVEAVRESLEGILTINLYNSQKYFFKLFQNKIEEWEKAATEKMRYFYTYWGITSYMEYTLPVFILAIGSLMSYWNLITIPILIAFFFIVGRVYIPVWNLNFLITTIPASYPSARRVLEIINYRENYILEKKHYDFSLPENFEQIKFENVSFSYNKNERVISDLNLQINCNKWVTIVGPTGSGKTTLFYLLLRIFEPESGKIYINGRNLNSCSLNEIRRQIAYVPNKDFIFNTTIKENLTLGIEYEEPQISKIIKVCQIDEFAIDLDMNALGLSDGQKQRIALARALLRLPKILILDEATAPIDAEIEAKIFSNIKKHFPSLSIILASHRLSTIKLADEIVVLKSGKVLSTGTHEVLFKECQFYKELIEKQIII